MNYIKEILPNSMRVLVNEDPNTPLISLSILYGVGARDENPDRTGLAHLLEHLMFSGTEQYPDFDMEVDRLGGESNAFTNNDYTNYYLTVPADKLEDALRLEADRLANMRVSQHSLEVQRKVVTEEYNQRYLGQPYGDVYMLLRPLCYYSHPYRWCTIGADIRHVQEASLQEVRDFYSNFYCPNNAIMALSGSLPRGMNARDVVSLVERYFGQIERGNVLRRSFPSDGFKEAPQRLSVSRPVPSDALYLAFPMSDRLSPDYSVYDLISDLLSNGNSSRLYLDLVKDRHLFTEVNAFVLGDVGPGLLVINGKLVEGTSIEDGETAIWDSLRSLTEREVDRHELDKVLNKFESNFVYSQYKAIDRAMSLCYYEWLGQIDWVGNEPDRYRDTTPADVLRVARQTFLPNNCYTLEYRKL